MKKRLTINRLYLLIPIALAGIALGVYFRLRTPKPEPYSHLPLATEPLPTITPVSLTTLDTHELTINWSQLKLDLPSVLPYYQASPLLTSDQVNKIASFLGFTSSNQIPTNDPSNQLWINNAASLHYALTPQLLTFSTSLPATSFPDKTLAELTDAAQSLVKNLLNLTDLKLSQTQQLPAADLDTANSSPPVNLSYFYFDQTLDGFPLVTVSTTTASVLLVLAPNGQLVRFEISNLPTNPVPQAKQALASPNQIKTQGHLFAQRLNFSLTLDQEQLFFDRPSVIFTPTSFDIVYILTDKLLQPQLRLIGPATVNSRSIPQLHYLVPVFSSAYSSP